MYYLVKANAESYFLFIFRNHYILASMERNNTELDVRDISNKNHDDPNFEEYRPMHDIAVLCFS